MAARTIQLPDLAEGETYAGLILKEDGTPSHHLIRLPGDNDDAPWAEQTAWAESIGGELPTHQEQSLLFANCKKHFEPAWYWSSTQHDSASDFAWRQYFYNGHQLNYHKGAELRAVAVRRLPIQQFSYSKSTTARKGRDFAGSQAGAIKSSRNAVSDTEQTGRTA